MEVQFASNKPLDVLCPREIIPFHTGTSAWTPDTFCGYSTQTEKVSASFHFLCSHSMRKE